jgi:hypothetical protein
VKIKTLYTYCEQVGRRGKDYERTVENLPASVMGAQGVILPVPIIVRCWVISGIEIETEYYFLRFKAVTNCSVRNSKNWKYLT